MIKKMWTEEEVKLLRAMAAYYSSTVIAERLGRGLSSVKFKLSQLGIRLRDRGWVDCDNPRHWKPEEIKILKKWAGKKSSYELRLLLPKRSYKAIRLKASQLNLSLFKTPWSIEEMDKLLELRKKGFSYPEIGKILNRTEGACRSKYKYLSY